MSNKEEKTKEITLTELAQEMRQGFATVRKELRDEISGVRQEISELREYVDQGFKTMDGKVDGIDERLATMVTKTHLDIRFDKLLAATFTEDQKESILDTINLVNNQLDASVLGQQSITLTRSEYDALINVAHLPNRFLNRGAVEVD